MAVGETFNLKLSLSISTFKSAQVCGFIELWGEREEAVIQKAIKLMKIACFMPCLSKSDYVSLQDNVQWHIAT